MIILSPSGAVLEGKEEIRHFLRQCPYNRLPCNFFYCLERAALHENILSINNCKSTVELPVLRSASAESRGVPAIRGIEFQVEADMNIFASRLPSLSPFYRCS